MKIYENKKGTSPVLVVQVCCKLMQEAIFKDHIFSFHNWDFRLKDITILCCPFCGKLIEYVESEMCSVSIV